jgi:hypothetical protein
MVSLPIKTAKKKVVEILVDSGIIASNFTGRIVINLNDGACCDMEKNEKVK